MANTFVPLTALTGGAGRGETQLKIITQAETKAIFQPLPGVGVSNAGGTGVSCAQPSITFQRQGEVISGIRVECGCGQVIELACSY
jgi:hypothetical protein